MRDHSFLWLLVLTSAFLAVTAQAVLAKKGDIVPEAREGVQIHKRPGGLVASVKTSTYWFDTLVVSHHGLLSVNVEIRNISDGPLNISPESVQLESAGAPIPPLTPKVYVSIATDARPYKVDKGDQILVNAPEEPDEAKPGETPGKPKKNDWHKARGTPEARMAITKDLIRLRHDLLTTGGVIPPGKSAVGRHEYQRNGLDLPLVVKFQPAGSEETTEVRYVREK